MFGAVARPPGRRPPQVPAVPLQAASSSSDPAPLHFQQLQVRLLSCLSGPCLFRARPSWDPMCLLALAGPVRPWLRLQTCPLMHFLQFLLAMLIVAAVVWDLSAVSRVTIRSVQTSVRVWMILPGVVGTSAMPAMPATSGAGDLRVKAKNIHSVHCGCVHVLSSIPIRCCYLFYLDGKPSSVRSLLCVPLRIVQVSLGLALPSQACHIALMMQL